MHTILLRNNLSLCPKTVVATAIVQSYYINVALSGVVREKLSEDVYGRAGQGVRNGKWR